MLATCASLLATCLWSSHFFYRPRRRETLIYKSRVGPNGGMHCLVTLFVVLQHTCWPCMPCRCALSCLARVHVHPPACGVVEPWLDFVQASNRVRLFVPFLECSFRLSPVLGPVCWHTSSRAVIQTTWWRQCLTCY